MPTATGAPDAPAVVFSRWAATVAPQAAATAPAVSGSVGGGHELVWTCPAPKRREPEPDAPPNAPGIMPAAWPCRMTCLTFCLKYPLYNPPDVQPIDGDMPLLSVQDL